MTLAAATIYSTVAHADDAPIPAAVLSSVNHVESLDTGSACSVQSTGEGGYYLTAMHCVRKSIANQGPQLRMEDQAPIYYRDWKVRDLSKLPYRTHAIEDAYWLRVPESPCEPDVLGLGRGYLEYPPQINNFQDFNAIAAKFEDLKQFQEDFILLHFDQTNPFAPCVPSQSDIPADGTDAWIAGFPESTPPAKPQRVVMAGKIFNNFTKLKAWAHAYETYPEEAWFDSERFMLFTGQAKPGMSGGGVFDKDGNLIGIIVAVTASGNTIVERLSFIKGYLSKTLPPEVVAKAFKCRK